MVDWLRERMLADGKISPHDIEQIEVTDDLDAVLEICRAADHRRPRTDAEAA